MSPAQKLFSFDGRIRRRDWWLLGIAVAVVSYIIQQVINASLGVNPMQMMMPNAAGGLNIDAGQLRTATIASAVVGLLFLWPSAALSIKRAHDRNMGALIVIAFYALYAVLMLAGAWVGVQMAAALASGTAEAAAASVGGGAAMIGLLGIVVAIYALVLLVILGFLEGTPGPNRFGPSPKGLGGTAESFA